MAHAEVKTPSSPDTTLLSAIVLSVSSMICFVIQRRESGVRSLGISLSKNFSRMRFRYNISIGSVPLYMNILGRNDCLHPVRLARDGLFSQNFDMYNKYFDINYMNICFDFPFLFVCSAYFFINLFVCLNIYDLFYYDCFYDLKVST